MENIDKLITKYGPEIAKQLQITTTQIHEKLIWYLKIDGIINLLEVLGFFLVSIIYWMIAWPIIKKWHKQDKYLNDYFIGGLCALLLHAVIFLIYVFFIGIIVDSLAKIFAPDYWLIQQVINKVN